MELKSDYLDKLITHCTENKATDLHLCIGSRPMMRANAKLSAIPQTDLLSPMAMNLISENLVSREKRDLLRANRVLDFSFSRPGLGRFRCNIYQQRGTYAVAIRLLPFTIPPFSALGLPASVKNLIHKEKGLILITGAPSSGKSTTLAALIDLINQSRHEHIITIEDPIEYLHRHQKSLVTQREIGEDADSTAIALRSALREDPDIIMVGDTRDPDVLSLALTAAESGYLVFSALDSAGVVKTIRYITNAFPSEHHHHISSRLASVLQGIVSQQLLPHLKEPGLVLASEVLLATPAIRHMIRDSAYDQIRNALHTDPSSGMQLMEADLARLCRENKISLPEAQLHALDPHLFSQYLQ